jgi:hypothetical protein
VVTGGAYRYACEGDPCRRLHYDRHGNPTNLADMELGTDPGPGKRYHPGCEPIGFPGDAPTATQKAEHERHAAAGENRWFTCPLCDDEGDE